jgi:nucleoside-diphosphate-sugar epimerase
MKRIVVTGATSMIGVALIEECLQHGIEVYALVRADSAKRIRLETLIKQHPSCAGLLHFVECSLEELETLPDKIPDPCDTFYHIAWGSTGANRNRSTELQSRNITYTLQAVQAAHSLGCVRFIGAGSQAEYGPKDTEKISPDDPTDPTTPYGAAKLSACYLSSMLCKELGISWIWPRIFSVYGIYEKETTMVATALRRMLHEEETAFTPALHRWDYLYSKDAGKAFYLIGEKGKDGSIYCLGSGDGRPLKAYIEEMAQILGVRETGIGRLPYSAGPIVNLCADITTLTEDTGFVPEYSFEKGIRDTVSWIRKTETR